jgi:membrane-anchored glycerophosphoryl diester phosphodiesterase (GDPDase)
LETAELRPLSLGELLDRTFTVYRGNFAVFAGIMAIPAALGIPITYLVIQFDSTMLANPASGVPTNPAEVFGRLGLLIGFFLAASLVYTLVYSIIVAAMTHAISESYLGHKSTIVEAYRSVRGKVWRLFGVALNILVRLIGIAFLVSGVVGMIGGLLIGVTAVAIPFRSAEAQMVVGIAVIIMALLVYALIIAGIVYVGLRYAVAVPALALENLGVLASIRRSVQLTKGRRGQIFVAVLLGFLINLVGSMVFYLPFSLPMTIMMMRDHAVPAWLSMVGAVSAAIGTCLTSPIFMIILVLCYYDTRVRKEAFDLQFLMASLDRAAPAVSGAPSA